MGAAQSSDRAKAAVEAVGGTFDINGAPNELAMAVPFAKDTETRPYDMDSLLYDGNEAPFLPSCARRNVGDETPEHRDWFDRPCIEDDRR